MARTGSAHVHLFGLVWNDGDARAGVCDRGPPHLGMDTIHARHRLRNLLPLFRIRCTGGAFHLRRNSRVTFRTLRAETGGFGTSRLISRLPSLDLDACPLLSRSWRSQSGAAGRLHAPTSAVGLLTWLSECRSDLTGDGCLAVACVPGAG